MGLEVTNSMTGKKEAFVPGQPGRVGLYVCGPTVYDHAHLGHAKSYIAFDVVVRTLRYLGYRVRYVQNITDVGHLTDNADDGEDKILKKAALELLEPMEIAEKYARSFLEDMDALGNWRPDISPRASGHIPEQIQLVQTLLDKGHAYVSNGSVYFAVSSFPGYGKLTGRRPSEMTLLSRLDENQEKRALEDFALWKSAPSSHLMRWPSPWGLGYPGWHLECSAMSMKYLGQTLDIHGGGLENAFPHHECEIAQSEAATGVPFVRYWLHNNMVTVHGTKMGKSLGNFVTLKQAFEKTHPQHIRFFVLSSHYRHPLDFSEEALLAGARGHERLTAAWSAAEERSSPLGSGGADDRVSLEGSPLREVWDEGIAAMEDDFNTPRALAALFEGVKRVNRAVDDKDTSFPFEHARSLFRTLGGDVLGLRPVERRQGQDVDALVRLLIDMRADLRKAKQWELADSVRDRLKALGYALEDTQQGTRYSVVR